MSGLLSRAADYVWPLRVVRRAHAKYLALPSAMEGFDLAAFTRTQEMCEQTVNKLNGQRDKLLVLLKRAEEELECAEP